MVNRLVPTCYTVVFCFFNGVTWDILVAITMVYDDRMIDIIPTTMVFFEYHGIINGNYFVGNGDFRMKHGDIMGIVSGGKTMSFKLAMIGNGIQVYHIFLW